MTAPFAYVVWNFPKLSETFVVEELAALDTLGLRPVIVARDRPAGERINDRARPFLDRTTWLRDAPGPARASRVARIAARHPVRVLRTVALALSTRSRRVVENLWHACLLADEVERRGLRYLHAHFADTAGDLVLFASRITGVPFGLTVHAVDIYLGHLLPQKLDGASLWVTVCQYNLTQIEPRCPGTDLGRALIKYAGVNVDQFRLTEPRPARAAEHVLAIGRLTPKKGFDQLIEAMGQLRAEGFDRLRCTIIGSGRCHDELEALIAARGLGDVVTLAGDLTPEEVRAHLASADLFVSPCTVASTGNRDSMPVVIKEAMAMELPIVATDDFGIPEMVLPGSGLLFPRDDVSALTAAMRSIVTASPERRAEMGRAARDIVVEHFDEKAGAAALAVQLRAILDEA